MPPSPRPFPWSRLLPIAFAALGITLTYLLVPAEKARVTETLLGFPDADTSAHLLRPWVLTSLTFLPLLASLTYLASNTWSRYLTRQFLAIFTICFSALFGIWLILDLQNNLSDFTQNPHGTHLLLQFYSTRMPAILMLILPYTLLLSQLYCLGKLSKSREILATIQTGRSLLQIISPLLFYGLLFSALCAGLNYQWAPSAEQESKEIQDIARGATPTAATNVLFRNAAKNRLWMIASFPPNYQKNNQTLRFIDVTHSNPDGSLNFRLRATSAQWNREKRTWTFLNAKVIHFQKNQPPAIHPYPQPLTISDWEETPMQLVKPGLQASYLGIPDLNSWLITNHGNETTLPPAPYLTQWHYRWAQAAICLVTVLLASSLGIDYSRRGNPGSIALAIFLSAILIFSANISLNLGEAGYLTPFLAAWLPNILFTLIGFYLLHRRTSGLPIIQLVRSWFSND